MGSRRGGTSPSQVLVALGSDLGPGVVAVTIPDGTFLRTLVGADATTTPDATHSISPRIYGVAFPERATAQATGFELTAVGR